MAKAEETPLTLYHLLTEVFVLLDDADRRTLKQHNLSIRQYNVLYHLQAEHGLSINDLSGKLLCDKSNTTRLVERMKQEELVTRKRDTQDRRYVSVALTPKGEELRKNATSDHFNNINREFVSLSADEQTQLINLLTRLRNGLKEHIQTLQTG